MYKNNEIHSHFTRNSNLLRIPKGTPNFTTISARVWNEIVTKIIMDQHGMVWYGNVLFDIIE